MSRPRRTSVTILLGLSILAVMAGPARADGAGPRAIEGVWAMSLTLRDCATGAPLGPPFRSLLTFHTGGTLSESAGTTRVRPRSALPGHGLWSRSGAQHVRGAFRRDDPVRHAAGAAGARVPSRLAGSRGQFHPRRCQSPEHHGHRAVPRPQPEYVSIGVSDGDGGEVPLARNACEKCGFAKARPELDFGYRSKSPGSMIAPDELDLRGVLTNHPAFNTAADWSPTMRLFVPGFTISCIAFTFGHSASAQRGGHQGTARLDSRRGDGARSAQGDADEADYVGTARRNVPRADRRLLTTPARRSTRSSTSTPTRAPRRAPSTRRGIPASPAARCYGIPVLLKDNVDTADMPTTAGSVALAGIASRPTTPSSRASCARPARSSSARRR